jgi:putative ABC transport system permease protein
MNHSIQTIPLLNLSIAFIPALFTLVILFKWSLNSTNALYAIARMLIQLLLIGYVLTFIFESDSAGIVIIILIVMVIASSWIALGSISKDRLSLYKYACLAIALGGGFTLMLITQGVLQLHPWYAPQSMIPIAGMIFANAMNSVSLAAERLHAELGRNVDYDDARKIALQSSLIPVINALFAVGLVSLPGMMTGQILSGVSPLIAARYQIMVMCMIFCATGISTAYFLVLVKPVFERQRAVAADSSIEPEN